MNMDKSKELFEKKILNNNLELVIYAHYKHTAGDRFQITFEAEVNVDIDEEYFKDIALDNLDIYKVISMLGDKTSYRYSKTRNFIPADQKARVFEELKQQFLDNNLAYISLPSFPSRLIKRNYLTAEKEEMIRIQREAYMKNL